MTRPVLAGATTIGALFILSLTVRAQSPAKQVHEREQAWVGYFNQTRFSDHWGLWADVHYRMTDNFTGRPFQYLFRSAVTYFIKDNLRVNAGYTFVSHLPAKGLKTVRTEHRPWQQISWNQKYPGLTTLQWVRLEQRFNENVAPDVTREGYIYNFRVRYSFSFLLPLKGNEIASKTPFAVLTDEVFLNFGRRIVFNTFDQNRLFAGFGYQFCSRFTAQLGYMNIYQQESAGNTYWSTHTVRLFVSHVLDLRSSQ